MTQFRDNELRRQRQASMRRKAALRAGQADPFCTYLLGNLDDEGEHSRAAELEDRFYRDAYKVIQGRE